TAPAGWTLLGNLRTSGTLLEQALYYRIATAADTAASTYSWSWLTNADASGAILAYSGFDATSPFDVTPTDNAASTASAIATGLTATQTNDMLIAFYGAQTNVTLTQDASQGMTQEYTVQSGSGPASRSNSTGADGSQAGSGATGNKTATVSASTPWVAHLVALMPPLAADGAGTLTTPTTNVSASQTGNTITFTYTAAAGGMQNGSITLVVPAGWTAPSTTTNVSASQTGRTLTFTYTAATGGISNGSVTLVVPAGWSAPSTTGANAGYTTASSGTVAVAAQTITVSSLTLAGGSTFTITYG